MFSSYCPNTLYTDGNILGYSCECEAKWMIAQSYEERIHTVRWKKGWFYFIFVLISHTDHPEGHKLFSVPNSLTLMVRIPKKHLKGEVYSKSWNSQVIPYSGVCPLPRSLLVVLYLNSCKNGSRDSWRCWMHALLYYVASEFRIQKSTKRGQMCCFIESVWCNELFLSKVLSFLSQETCTFTPKTFAIIVCHYFM